MMSAAGGGSGAAPAISPPAPRARQASKVEAPPPVWIKLRGAYIECEPFRVPISRRCRNIDDLRTVVQAAAPALRRFHQSRLEVYLHDGAERSTPLGLGDSIPASASECADKALNVELFVPTRVWVYLPTFPAPSTARQVHTDSCRTIGDFRTPIMKAFAAELGAFCESELRMRLSLEEGDEAENVLADLEFPLTHLPASVVMNSATPLCIRVVPVPGLRAVSGGAGRAGGAAGASGAALALIGTDDLGCIPWFDMLHYLMVTGRSLTEDVRNGRMAYLALRSESSRSSKAAAGGDGKLKPE